MLKKQHRRPGIFILAIACMFGWSSTCLGQNAGSLMAGINHGFIENVGQMKDQSGKPDAAVKYMLSCPGNNIALYADGFSYNTYVQTGIAETQTDVPGRQHAVPQYRFHRIDVRFENANDRIHIVGEAPSASVINYYEANGQLAQARHFGKIVYQNVYPGIDIEFVVVGQDSIRNMEYNFIVHPEASIADIKLRYAGADESELMDNAVVLSLAHGKLWESIPASYWQASREAVDVHYNKISQDDHSITLGFASNVTHVDQDLVIDPTPYLDWATYFGGNGDDTGTAVAYDNAGNIFVGGTTNSSDLHTSGAFQTILSGGVDCFITKLTPSGSIIWTTYYGGAGYESLDDMVLDANGNIYLTMQTNSPNMQTSGGGLIGGARDVLVAKFGANGTRQWATYFGGLNNDSSTGIAVDQNGVYITGLTNSSDLVFPTGPNTHKSKMATTTEWDAFIVKFSLTGVRQWATMYGGNAQDYGWDIDLDGSGNVYVLGTTTSSETNPANGIYAGGAHQSTMGNPSLSWNDAFVCKFNSNGQRIWGTYYGGAGDETASKIKVDGNGDIYICGGTSSSNNISAGAGIFQSSRPGAGTNRDGYIAKFNTSGIRQWGTYYGPNSQADPIAGLSISSNGNLYVTGSTYNYSGFTYPTTGTATGNKRSAYVSIFNKTDGNRTWSTTFGGGEDDYGVDLVCDQAGNIYVIGNTTSTDFPMKGNLPRNTLVGESDLFIAKFLPLPPCDILFVDPQLTISSLSVYVGREITITAGNHQQGYHSYAYNFKYGQGSSRIEDQFTTTQGSHSYTFVSKGSQYPAVGFHDITVVVTDSYGCTKTIMFRVEIKKINPLCEVTFSLATPSQVRLDNFSGNYVFHTDANCITNNISMECIRGEVTPSLLNNVVSTSASTYSDDWKSGDVAGGNTFERGEAGKWRAQATYAYNKGSVKVDKNYNSGTFTPSNFNWDYPEMNLRTGWLRVNQIQRYSPHGESLQEIDALNMVSVAKFGYEDNVPYLIAKNAEYADVTFESFEKTYGPDDLLEDATPSLGGTLDGASAHSGAVSFRLLSRFSTRAIPYDAKLVAKGILVRVWAKGTSPGTSMSLLVHAATSDQVVAGPISFESIATAGEWSLWQGKIPPNGFILPAGVNTFRVALQKVGTTDVRVDDLRIQPIDAEMTCYVYDKRTLRLLATLDDQHFGTFYQYNTEGKLIRKMIETERGKKTVQETHYNTPRVSPTSQP